MPSLIPAQLLIARIIVLQLVSLAAVGAVEAGRLVVAPIQTVINGAGGFLLSSAAERERRPQDTSRRMAERAVLLLVVITILGGCLAAALAHPLGRLMTGRAVSPTLVLGWTLGDEGRAQRLLALTGLAPEDLRAGLGDPALLAALLRFLEAHEPDLLTCAEALGVTAPDLVEARRRLEG